MFIDLMHDSSGVIDTTASIRNRVYIVPPNRFIEEGSGVTAAAVGRDKALAASRLKLVMHATSEACLERDSGMR